MAIDKDQNETRLAESFDRIADTMWREFEEPGGSVYSYARKTHFIELLDMMDHPRILDAGGGTGAWSIMLARLGYDVTLLDISPVSLDIARKHAAYLGLTFPIDLGSIESTSYADESFDFVVAMGGVITYTPHPTVMLEEMNRLLGPGGMLWVDYYNALGWAIQIGRAELTEVDEGWLFNPEMRYPERAFSHAHMEKLISDLGLRVIRRIGYGLTDLSEPEGASRDKLDELKAVALAVSRDESCFGACGCGIMVAKK